MRQGTVLKYPLNPGEDQSENDLLVLDYNAGNSMAVVAELEYVGRHRASPAAVPVRIEGGRAPASALIHRIRSLDIGERDLRPTTTADTRQMEIATRRLRQMIGG